jgi:RNA polymerase sigma factor (sigma-70 family)
MDPSTSESFGRHLETLFLDGCAGGLTDRQLLERFAGGRADAAEPAFEAVVKRHGPMVLGVCRRLIKDAHLAEDAFQATFLVLALKARSIVKRESLGPWLHGVAARVAVRARGLAAARREESLGGHEPPILDASRANLAEIRAVLDAELIRLPEKYRRPIVLCFLEGKTQDEAAAVLGWTKGTVSGRIARAKDLLRRRLDRRGLAPSAGALVVALTSENARAGVPASLAAATVQSARALALGNSAAAVVPGTVSSLVRIGLNALVLGQVKAGVSVLSVLLGLGLGVTAYALAAPGGEVDAQAPPPVAAAPTKRPLAPSRKAEPARPKPSPSPSGEFGTIRGRLVWGGDTIPQREVYAAVGKAPRDPGVCAKDAPILSQKLVVDEKTKGVRDAFAYLVRPAAANPKREAELIDTFPEVDFDQKACYFVPHSIAIHERQQLVIRSSDPIVHNVHLTAFTNAPMNRVMPAGQELRPRLVAERRPLPIVCDIHPWMKANLMVFNHPFFAVTAADGSFEIRGVPAGSQQLVLWQESAGYVTEAGTRGRNIVVEAGMALDLGEIRLDPARVK